ncbi:MAG: hypothetical protein HYX28_09710 [Candidatus Koribacter versatilis]|uniref:Anthranilate phosphoribosyltransferase n=1 Tax=Candidatus Korobacter versatilis TaxID=658062 RepID=A0A932ERN3_9BACT|nr:hypothetical protein [Candidatus Koribacter versatilis]
MGDKFNVTEVAALRNELLQGGLDSMQAAEVVRMFLMGHGYGISTDAALDAASRITGGSSVESVQASLEDLALVM